jgi:peptide/nickel transport system substrate-binding protein
MQRRALRALAPVVAVGLAVGVAACGGGSSNKSGTTGNGNVTQGKKGGTLQVQAAGDFEHVDPGQAYYQFDYMMEFVTQRPLYNWKPNTNTVPDPDLAAGAPQVSDGGKTVTVKIKKGVKFSPPVNRAVTSKDVQYAIERAATPNVANGYVGVYFGDVVGWKDFPKKAKHIAGITTPDNQTIVFKLDRPVAGTLAQALSLPASAPVPPEYAKKYDAKNPSTYAQHMVFTGPYMMSTYQPGKKAVLKRNPNWDPKTDWRPAYLDQIIFSMGNDATVASRQILSGQNQVSGDFGAPAPIVKQASTSKKDQITFTPSSGNRYVALNTTIKPLDNINVRKAIIAATDRNALRLTRGGPSVGDIATHFIPPGMPGFEEAGGMAGSGYDFLKNPNGDMALAQSYMKKAGYPSGKYTGSQKLLMVGDNAEPGSKTAQVMQQQLQKLGFKLNFRQVPHDTMYSKFCNVPKSKVAICPNVGWLKDFEDAQTMMDPTFNGTAIVPVNNSNWPQLNDPTVNAAMKKAELLTDADARAKAWGEIDKMVTGLAPAVPWLWDKQANIRSAAVNGVINQFNASWDLAYTSLKNP